MLINLNSIRNIKTHKLDTEFLIKILIAYALIINLLAALFPILSSNDSYFYSVIAQHIVQSNDWINLQYANHDWLDKPHLPFWLTAISYKIFGIKPFSYILPGLLFHLIGVRYTYLLSKLLYDNKLLALFASIIYLSSIRILLSSVDVRAEAFLLGQITPAVYYLVLLSNIKNYNLSKYNTIDHDSINYKYLLLAILFTASAIMTKGLIAFLVITSGVFGTLLYTRQLKKIFQTKYLFFVLGTIFAAAALPLLKSPLA